MLIDENGSAGCYEKEKALLGDAWRWDGVVILYIFNF